MPYSNGQYSKADIAKKLSGAIFSLAKNSLQTAVYMAFDAIGMIRHNNPEMRVPDDLSVPAVMGAAEGSHGRGFSRAVIAEPLATAILSVGTGSWSEAMAQIRQSLVMMKRLGDKQNIALKMGTTPDHLARHVVEER